MKKLAVFLVLLPIGCGDAPKSKPQQGPLTLFSDLDASLQDVEMSDADRILTARLLGRWNLKAPPSYHFHMTGPSTTQRVEAPYIGAYIHFHKDGKVVGTKIGVNGNTTPQELAVYDDTFVATWRVWEGKVRFIEQGPGHVSAYFKSVTLDGDTMTLKMHNIYSDSALSHVYVRAETPRNNRMHTEPAAGPVSSREQLPPAR